MLHMPWDGTLRASTEATRASMSLHHCADVVRLAVNSTPELLGVFDTQNTQRLEKSTQLLLPFQPDDDAGFTEVRMAVSDIDKAERAARLLSYSLGDFAYRATRFFVELERQMPGHMAAIQATIAREDLIARQVLELKDTQPWGEEDYRDYGRPDIE